MPDCLIPLKSALIPCNELPMFQDDDITGSYIICVAPSIERGAGSGSCDPFIGWIHWFGSVQHSERLHESIACAINWETKLYLRMMLELSFFISG